MSFMANCKTFQFDSNINRERIIIQKLYFSPTPFHHPSTYHTMHPLSRPFISSLVHHHQLIPFWSNDHRIHWVTVQDSTRETIKNQHEVLHVFLTFHCNPMRLTLFTFPARLSFSRIPTMNLKSKEAMVIEWIPDPFPSLQIETLTNSKIIPSR